jgi:thiol-disulfide isomerase/thioredoxin
MKVLLSTIILSVGLLFHAQAGKIVVTGTARHFTGDTLTFSYERYSLLQKNETLKIPVKDGMFTLTLNSDVPLGGYLSFGRVPIIYQVQLHFPDGKDSAYTVEGNDPRLVFLYLQPGSALNMKLDVNAIDQTLQFTGANADDNLFVNKEDWILNAYVQRVLRNYHEPVNFSAEEFTVINKQRFDHKLHFLDSMSTAYQLSPAIKERYYWKFYSEWINARLNYPKTHETYTSEKARLPANYFNFLDSVKIPDTGSNKGLGYWYFLDAVMRKKLELRSDSALTLVSFVQQQLQGRSRYEYLAYSLNRRLSPEILNMFGKDCPYPDLAGIVQARFGRLKSMLPGSPAPLVTLLAANGNKTSFSDFKGKYLYVDLWATWCGPCIKEIPDLLKLEAEYRGKDITFLSVSFDKEADVQKWKEFIKTNTMIDIQLRAENAGNRLLTDAWNISMIPRFVILDKEGKVVDANAPFPSSKEIRWALNKFL